MDKMGETYGEFQHNKSTKKIYEIHILELKCLTSEFKNSLDRFNN